MRTWIWEEETKLFFAYIIDHVGKAKEFTEKDQLQMIVKTTAELLVESSCSACLKPRVQSPTLLTKC